MKPSFSAEQTRAIQELVGLPPRLSKGSTPAETSVPIDEVRRVLDLPQPRYRELLAADRWLVGGSPMRWLARGLGKGENRRGDYDLFFPSIDAFNRTARRLFALDFTFRCFWTMRTMCQLCGRPGQLVRFDTVDDLNLPLPRVRCRVCGEFGGFDASSLTPDRLLRVTPEMIATRQVRALELLSPSRDIFHLNAASIRPTPHEMLDLSDWSQCQFAIDDQNLYFAPYAWTDLLRGRLRLLRDATPNATFQRLRRYMALGFRPYPESFARIAFACLRQLLKGSEERR